MPSFKTGKRALLALGLGLAATGMAPAAASAATDIVLCNKTGAPVAVAIIFQDQTSGQWMLNAWKTRAPGQCASAGAIKTGLFYYYAEKQGTNFHWPAQSGVDKNFCVPRSAVLRPSNTACGVGEKSYGFKGAVAGTGTYTVNFQ